MNSFRRALSISQSLAIRGPKKKKGGAAVEAPLSNDICNIWKDRGDPKIYASDKYPPYLMDMIKEKYGNDDVVFQMYRGERIPTPKEQWSLAKSMKRTFIVDGNYMTKRDWAYESDDDLGEDLGQDVVDEDYEEELEDGDEEGAVKKPMTEEERLMKEAGM
tara:strand:+ start:49 stop:531 length:483 start_codon:yes stop_codon:yes gene_type:complete